MESMTVHLSLWKPQRRVDTKWRKGFAGSCANRVAFYTNVYSGIRELVRLIVEDLG